MLWNTRPYKNKSFWICEGGDVLTALALALARGAAPVAPRGRMLPENAHVPWRLPAALPQSRASHLNLK